MLLQVIREVGVGIQEVKSQAPAFSLEELALAITPLVAHIFRIQARVGLDIEHEKWNGAFARRASQLLESTLNAPGTDHVPVFVRQRRIFVEVRRLTLCSGALPEVERRRLWSNAHDALIDGVRQVEHV